MALSFQAVQAAYKVFNELKAHIDLSIPSWPEDASQWSAQKKDNPPLNQVVGWDKKSDDGWENLFFVTSNPSEELKRKFDDLKNVVPNSSMNEQYPYGANSELWMIGWF